MSQLLTLSQERKLAFNDAKIFPAHIFFTNLGSEKIYFSHLYDDEKKIIS